LQLLPKTRIKLIYRGSGVAKVDTTAYSKITLSSPPPTSKITRGGEYSRNGKYMGLVVDSDTSNESIYVYKRSGLTYTKVSPIVPAPASNPQYYCGFSSDATYLAIANGDTNRYYVYKRSGDTFNAMSFSAPTVSSSATWCGFSADDRYLAFTNMSVTGTRLHVYVRSGDSFSLTTVTSPPACECYGGAWSNDGNYLAVAGAASPYLYIYKRNGDTFALLSAPATIPPSGSYHCAFSPDDKYLSVSFVSATGVFVYKRVGDNFVYFANPSATYGAYAENCSFSANGRYLAVAHQISPYITFFEIKNDEFIKLPLLAGGQVPAAAGIGGSFSPDSEHLILTNGGAADYTLYNTTTASSKQWEIAWMEVLQEDDKQFMFV